MNLHYTIEGNEQGPAIVFLHGMAGSARYWKTLINQLPLNKNRIICIDLLGFGLSPKPNNINYSYSDHITAVQGLLNELGLKEFTLVGHSMGALLALRLATKTQLKIQKLILVNMPYYENPIVAREAITHNSLVWRVILYGKSSHFICSLWCSRLRLFSKHLAPIYLSYLPKEAAQDSLLHTWKSYDGSLRNIIEHQTVKRDLESLSIPVEVMYGSNDPSYIDFMRLKETLTISPNCKLEVVDNAGHHVPITNPEKLISLLS